VTIQVLPSHRRTKEIFLTYDTHQQNGYSDYENVDDQVDFLIDSIHVNGSGIFEGWGTEKIRRPRFEVNDVY
jgi:hypothetical protein